MVYPLPCGKVWLSSLVWSACASAKPGNKEQRRKTQHFRTVGKNSGLILSRLCTKVHVVLRRCRRSLLVFNAFTDCLYHLAFRRHRPLNLPFCREVVENKSAVFKPQIFAGWRLQTFWAICYHGLPPNVWQSIGWVPWSEVRVRSPAMNRSA